MTVPRARILDLVKVRKDPECIIASLTDREHLIPETMPPLLLDLQPHTGSHGEQDPAPAPQRPLGSGLLSAAHADVQGRPGGVSGPGDLGR